jgi:tryptophanyl-tRNA synthetase
MFTDPGHVRASDPGRVEDNVVFAYLRAFDPDQQAVAELEAHYRRGGLGDAALKERLTHILQTFLAPIRERRARYAQDRDIVRDVLRDGTKASRSTASAVLEEVRDVFSLGSL